MAMSPHYTSTVQLTARTHPPLPPPVQHHSSHWGILLMFFGLVFYPGHTNSLLSKYKEFNWIFFIISNSSREIFSVLSGICNSCFFIIICRACELALCALLEIINEIWNKTKLTEVPLALLYPQPDMLLFITTLYFMPGDCFQATWQCSYPK